MTNSFFTTAGGSRSNVQRALRLSAALLLAAFVVMNMQAQSSSGKKIPGAGKAAPVVMIDQLAQQADIVAVGRVERMESEWNADKSRIQTRVTLAVEQTIKGTGTEESMTILTSGGEVDGVGELYTHTVQFKKDEDVLVFANKDAKGDLRVTAGTDGKFLIQKDAKTGVKRVRDLGTIEELSVRIKNSVKAQKTDSKRN